MRIDVLTPAAVLPPEEIEARMPGRLLPEGACVTRVGPSPTGFMHIGGLYAALISRCVARQSGGVFFLRIEDTDKGREVDGAVDLIVDSLQTFGLTPDEGHVTPAVEKGGHGPYRQSERKAIYHGFVRRLLEEGKAYPCFATPAELDQLRDRQKALKLPPGYYGRWAPWRGRGVADIDKALSDGIPFVIRLKAPETQPETLRLMDAIRGELTLPSNRMDAVLLKADGLPTYHLAHVVDDHLMGTTDVIRGHEWLSSYPLHAQLFEAFGWPLPRYAHISPIEKMVGASRRKISKRHDPEASVDFYRENGYPAGSVIDYLMTLVDSRFEEWRHTHPDVDAQDFRVDLGRLNRSGALFDIAKLDSISREHIGRMKASDVFEAALKWSKTYDMGLARLLAADPDYGTAILNIEREGRERVRKDIAKWSDVFETVSFFHDDTFETAGGRVGALLGEQPVPVAMLDEVVHSYDSTLSHEEWLTWLRAIGERHGYAPSVKVFKKSPRDYQGHLGDIANLLRIVLCARTNTPDLHEVMRVMGEDRVRDRIERALASALKKEIAVRTHRDREPETGVDLGATTEDAFSGIAGDAFEPFGNARG